LTHARYYTSQAERRHGADDIHNAVSMGHAMRKGLVWAALPLLVLTDWSTVPASAQADLLKDCFKATAVAGNGDRIVAVCSDALSSGQYETPGQKSLLLNNRSIGYVRQGDPDKALADLDEAIRVNPRDPFAYDNRGDIWRQKKDYDRALAEYAAALKADPTFISAYYNRGLTFEGKGDVKSARAEYQAAVKMPGKDRPLDKQAKNKAQERLNAIGKQ
jgi:tetratricopeptide (TPR) repeat protein